MTESEIKEAALKTLQILSDLMQELKADQGQPDPFPMLNAEQEAQLIGQLGPSIFTALLNVSQDNDSG